MNKKQIAMAVMCVLGAAAAVTAQAAVLQTGDLLSLTPGVQVYDSNGNTVNVSSGSFFAFDVQNKQTIQDIWKFAITPSTDGGIVVGQTQSSGTIDSIDWYGNIFSDYSTTAVTGGTTSGLNMSGWNLMEWGVVPASMGSGAWTPLNCAAEGVACSGYADGVGVFNWSGVYGDAFTLDYAARFPSTDSNFAYVRVFYHFEGTVVAASTVPVPAAAWLFGSGLMGLLGMVRRRVR